MQSLTDEIEHKAPKTNRRNLNKRLPEYIFLLSYVFEIGRPKNLSQIQTTSYRLRQNIRH